jgi:hypothetical protein
LTFNSEAEIVAAMSRIAATLPKEVRDRLSFGNGQSDVLQVIGADTRRTDNVFCSCSKFYGAEFKKGILRDAHLYDCLIRRRYSLTLRARHGSDLAGMIFVGESIDSSISPDSPAGIIKTLSEVFDTNIFVADTKNFARILVRKALLDVQNNVSNYSLYTLGQIPLQLHALTTASDGYPEWFDQEWLRKNYIEFARILESL